MKKAISLILVLLIIMPLSLVSFASDDYKFSKRLIDEAGVLSDIAETAAMSELSYVSMTSRMDLAVITVNGTGNKSYEDFLKEAYEELELGFGENRDGIILLIDMLGKTCFIETFGQASDIFFGNIKIMERNIGESIENVSCYEGIMSFASSCKNILKNNGHLLNDSDICSRLLDRAQLLSKQEHDNLLSVLNKVSLETGCDIVVSTIYSTEKDELVQAKEDFIDNSFGQGKNKDGIIFLLIPSENSWAIYSSGFCSDAVTEENRKYIVDHIMPFIEKGSYHHAFCEFASLSDYFIKEAKTGGGFENGNIPGSISSSHVLFALISLSLLCGFFLTFLLRMQMSGKKKPFFMGKYIKIQNVKIDEGQEKYLFSHMEKEEKEENKDNKKTM